MPIESLMPSKHLMFYCPLLLLPSVFPSIRVFSNESALHIRWPKFWSFSFSISPCNEYSGLISFRTDWFDPLAVQGTLKSLLHQNKWKASVLWHSAFCMGQLSHPYLTSGKAIALTLQGPLPANCCFYLGPCNKCCQFPSPQPDVSRLILLSTGENTKSGLLKKKKKLLLFFFFF